MYQESSSRSETPVIEAISASKTYTRLRREAGLRRALIALIRREWVTVEALSNINFRVYQGQIIGLVGANGSGKSSLIKMLAGVIPATTGIVRVLGHIPSRRKTEFLRRIGLILGQRSQLLQELPACEALNLHRAVYDISEDAFKAAVDEYSELLGVTDLLQIELRQLSLGERMKIELVAVLSHRPEVLLLDEPTIGLDNSSIAAMMKMLRDLASRRLITAIISSHSIEALTDVCDWYLNLAKGELEKSYCLPL